MSDYYGEENEATRFAQLAELPHCEDLPSVSQRLVVLEIMFLLRRPLSTYELYKELQKTFGLRTSYGTIYPWLRQLEHAEIISSESVVRKDRIHSQQRKRVYTLTNLGRSEFRRSFDSLAQVTKLLGGVVEESEKEYGLLNPLPRQTN